MPRKSRNRLLAILCFSLAIAIVVALLGYLFWNSFTRSKLALASLQPLPTITPTAVNTGPNRRYFAFPFRGYGLPRANQKHIIKTLAMGQAGQIWAGTEGEGVGVFDPARRAWRWFNTATGMPENDAYAIATDHQGRVWVGHANHGVSVFNGETWRNYDVSTGPLGPRVFAIAVCPIDGDVWIASDCGLSRYSPDSDSWSYYTRATGLPSDQASAIAFDSAGNLFLATQADGVSVALRSDAYQTWRTNPGLSQMPLTSAGQGIPSNFITDIAVTPTGVVYASTPRGLAFSTDTGQTWSFIRGRDWRADVAGLDLSPGPRGDDSGAILSEDRCTSLAVDGAGHLWVGHYRRGYDILDADNKPVPDPAHNGRAQLVNCILPIPTAGIALLASEEPNGGVLLAAVPGNDISPPPHPALGPTSFPSPAKPPTTDQLDALARQLHSLPPGNDPAEYLPDDWATQGDWFGHYGHEYAAVCGYFTEQTNPAIDVQPDVGPHQKGGPGFSRAAFSVINTHGADPRWLYDPRQAMRVIGEWNDGAWQDTRFYNTAWNGPDLWLRVALPDGVHRVSLYFLNKGSHTGAYDLEIQVRQSQGDLEDALQAPTLCQARVKNYWSGVYKQFALRGPGQFWFRIARNGSDFAAVTAVMIDDLAPKPAPPPPRPAATGLLSYIPPAISQSPANTSPLVQKARQLWDALDEATASPAALAAQRPWRTFAYRAALAAGADDDLLANWRWKLNIWTPADRKEFDSKLGL